MIAMKINRVKKGLDLKTHCFTFLGILFLGLVNTYGCYWRPANSNKI